MEPSITAREPTLLRGNLAWQGGQRVRVRGEEIVNRLVRLSPLWQLVHHTWDDFLANYEKHSPSRLMNPT